MHPPSPPSLSIFLTNHNQIASFPPAFSLTPANIKVSKRHFSLRRVAIIASFPKSLKRNNRGLVAYCIMLLDPTHTLCSP